MKNKLKFFMLIVFLGSWLESSALYIKVVKKFTIAEGRYGYFYVSDTREWIFVGVGLNAVLVRLVKINCEDPGGQDCPNATPVQEDDMTEFDANNREFMLNYAMIEMKAGRPDGNFSTTFDNGSESDNYKVEWQTGADGSTNVDVYLWVEEQ